MTRTVSAVSDVQSAMLSQPAPFRLMGEEVSVTVPGERTGGQLSMITSLSPPGGGPPPHIHRREDETIVALDPGFEVLIDGQWAALAIGSAAFIVRGTLHTFRNVGTQPARLVAHYTPAGFERFFALFALGGTPDNAMDRLAAAAASVGTQFFPGPLMNENMQSRWSSD